MTNREILNEIYDEYMDKLFRCSDNYLMTIPKRGMEASFYHYSEITERLKGFIDRADD